MLWYRNNFCNSHLSLCVCMFFFSDRFLSLKNVFLLLIYSCIVLRVFVEPKKFIICHICYLSTLLLALGFLNIVSGRLYMKLFLLLVCYSSVTPLLNQTILHQVFFSYLVVTIFNRNNPIRRQNAQTLQRSPQWFFLIAVLLLLKIGILNSFCYRYFYITEFFFSCIWTSHAVSAKYD